MSSPQDLTAIADFTDILDGLGIRYAVGGSMASSAYGIVRFTADADVAVEPFDDKADKLFDALKSGYYISKEAMWDALRLRGSFNIIHLESAFKIDVFISGDTAYDRHIIARRKSLKLSEAMEKPFWVVSPEDIVLLKLRWYQAGQCGSERQWNDILGILTVQADKLDFEYIGKWADILALKELLIKAVQQAKG